MSCENATVEEESKDYYVITGQNCFSQTKPADIR